MLLLPEESSGWINEKKQAEACFQVMQHVACWQLKEEDGDGAK